MSENYIQLATQQFSTNLQLRLQQQASKLRGMVMESMHIGKAASPVQYEGPIVAAAPSGRFAPLNRQDTTEMRRWVFPQDRETTQLIDSFDRLRSIVDPTNAHVMNAAAAFGREIDDVIIASAFATAQTGTDTGTLSAESFSSAESSAPAGTLTVADTFGNGSTTIGLTVEKLIEARRIFRKNHVDLESEQLCLIIGSTQEADLLKLVQVVSTEFNDRPVLVDGRVQRFLGFNIIVSERLNYASSIRNCIAFVKSGLYLGMWQDMVTDVSVMKHLSSQPYQIYNKMTIGATRLEPGRVIKVNCADAVTGDNV